VSSVSKRVAVGFQGGQVLELRMTDEQLTALQHVLGEGGWHQLETAEGSVRLDASQVCYVRNESDDQRVGFGT
jgi:hypothetical protein